MGIDCRVVVVGKPLWQVQPGVREGLNGYSLTFFSHSGEAFSQIGILQPHMLVIEDSYLDPATVSNLKQFSKDLAILLMLEDSKNLISILQRISLAGALFKNADFDEYFQAFNAIQRNRVYLSPRLTRVLMDSFKKPDVIPISSREIEIVKLMASGNSYTQISAVLNISPQTVKVHLKNIYRKSGTDSKRGVINMALSEKWI